MDDYPVMVICASAGSLAMWVFMEIGGYVS